MKHTSSRQEVSMDNEPREREDEPVRKPRRKSSKASTPTLLRLYLEEMSGTPLLNEKDEVRLASQLKEARRAIAETAMSLPSPCRDFALAGDESGPSLGAAWPLNRLAAFVERLTHYVRQHPEDGLVAAMNSVR